MVSTWWQVVGSKPIAPPLRAAIYAGAGVVFVLILFVRGGPNPAETDAHSVTLPATSISHGDLRAAERETLVPNPPGYPLLTAPLVVALRPWIGSPRWCDDKTIPPILHKVGASYFLSILGPCTAPHGADHGKPYPIWYRSQAVLAILGWVVLTSGAVMFLRAAGAGGDVGEAVLVVVLALLPTAADAIAQTFHPQDLMSVGLICAGMAQALKRRWVAVGAVFGVAFLCKQFAVLPLLGVVAAAPGLQARARILAPAVAVVAAGIAPFYVVAPVDTVRAMTAVYVAGVTLEKTPTVVGLLDIAEKSKLQIARDAPVVLAAVLALWARRRAGRACSHRSPSSVCASRAWRRGSCSRSRSSTTTSWPSGWRCCSSTSPADASRCGR